MPIAYVNMNWQQKFHSFTHFQHIHNNKYLIIARQKKTNNCFVNACNTCIYIYIYIYTHIYTTYLIYMICSFHTAVSTCIAPFWVMIPVSLAMDTSISQKYSAFVLEKEMLVQTYRTTWYHHQNLQYVQSYCTPSNINNLCDTNYRACSMHRCG